MKTYVVYFPVVILLFFVTHLPAQTRTEISLSGKGWNIVLDRNASWKKDSLYLPPVDLSKLPVNIPTGGWGLLVPNKSVEARVPGTTEEFLQKKSGPDADMTGVSWWFRTIKIPTFKKGQKVLLRMESTRYRAELFVNQQLVGYDAIGNTPYDVDITAAVRSGKEAQLAVRITNPGGVFDWKDNNIKWGNRIVPGSLGFGGITGRVKLTVCDPAYIEDIYLQNKPEITQANAIITLKNSTNRTITRDIVVVVTEKNDPTKELCRNSINHVKIAPGENKVEVPIVAPKAKVWDLATPYLYDAVVSIVENGEVKDVDQKRFGFRWFELAGIGNDATLRLNGKRVVLRTAISWGFWPVTGMVPSPELAEKQIQVAKQVGLNMLNFHRCIGQPLLLELADEYGLLYYEEPGNYAAATQFPLTRAMMHEKLMRMVKRDRSHPSMILFCMQNEVRDVTPEIFQIYKEDMKEAHRIDPSRAIVRTSGWALGNDIDDQAKLHMRPFDDQHYMNGWYDFHRATGPHTWMQSHYKGPKDYYSFTNNKKEIVYWGEEGALSTPGRVAKINESLNANANVGWDGEQYRKEYETFLHFYNMKQLSPSFPSLDALTMAMGNISFEHQGRKIENCRINNVADGYAINGWESEILENHSGIVDCYRNPKGDPAILAYYNQPLYVAVKSRKQVATTSSKVPVDFYLINEMNKIGAHHLTLTTKDAKGNELSRIDVPAQVSGGDVYGELLAEGVEVPTGEVGGMTRIEATLYNTANEVVARGADSLLVVDTKSKQITGKGATWEPGVIVRDFLNHNQELAVSPYTDKLPRLDWVVAARSPKGGELTFVPTEQLRDVKGASGVTVTYFMGENFDRQVAQQNEPIVNFSVNEGATPHPDLPATFNYSVRWEGSIVPPVTGRYSFDLENGYGGEARFWIDGQRADSINKMNNKLSISLVAGKEVKLRIELRHKRYTAASLLRWSVPETNGCDVQKLLERVKTDGTALVILENADAWMELIAKYTPIKYNGSFSVGRNWLGGVHFVKSHPLFKDLPVDCGMSWPYEAVVKNGPERKGLMLEGEELVAGAYHCFPLQLGTSVGIIPCGKGKIIFSTLEIYNNLRSPESTAEVARKLLYNFINYGIENKSTSK